MKKLQDYLIPHLQHLIAETCMKHGLEYDSMIGLTKPIKSGQMAIYGIHLPKNIVPEFIKKLDIIFAKAIKEDIKENGVTAIIRRKLLENGLKDPNALEKAIIQLQPYEINLIEIVAVYQLMVMEDATIFNYSKN